MAAHKSPRWSADELAVLRQHYPGGGAEAVLCLLSHRSFHAIHVKAHKLRLHTQQRGHAPRPKLAGDDLQEAIRLREVEGWSFERIGARFGVAESSVCNAVMLALCTRRGFTPAQRDRFGRLTPEGLDRVRYALKKGLRGIDIQLRLGVSASCVAEQRRRYNRDLAKRGKACLPPPGGGERYSGAKLTREDRAKVEALYLQGFGALKIAERTGISKTSCTRIRERLVRRLKRKGQCLPGCDSQGIRRAQAHSFRHVHPAQVAELRRLLLDRVPVARAAELAAIGSCTAYRIRDALAAELAERGELLVPPRRTGLKAYPLASDAYWPPRSPRQLYAFRALLEQLPFDQAKSRWRADRAAEARAKRTARTEWARTFEDHLRAIESGVPLVTVTPRIHLAPTLTERQCA